MTELSDLKLLERDAFRKFYEDGLVDVFFGLMLATMAIGPFVTDRFGNEAAGLVVMLGMAVILVTGMKVVRLRLLRTRLGDFRPGPERKRKLAATRLALLGSVVVGLAVFVLVAAAYRDGVSPVSIEVLMPLVWFVNAVVVIGAMAYFLDVPRFYLYGFLFGLVMPLLIWPDVWWDVRIPAWLAMGAPGTVMVAIGLSRLRRFLRDYPPLIVEREAVRGSR